MGNAYQPRASPWEPHPKELVCSEGTPHRKGRGRCPRHGDYAAFLQNAGMFGRWIPRVCTLGWYAMPIQGMGFETGLGHGIGNGSTLRKNGIEPDKKTFGEAFGAATGVSDPNDRRHRARACKMGGTR
jgi:hypothetical protein